MTRGLPLEQRRILYDIALEWQKKGVAIRLVCSKCNKLLDTPNPTILGYTCNKCGSKWVLR